jgi:hypothetical protein
MGAGTANARYNNSNTAGNSRQTINQAHAVRAIAESTLGKAKKAVLTFSREDVTKLVDTSLNSPFGHILKQALTEIMSADEEALARMNMSPMRNTPKEAEVLGKFLGFDDLPAPNKLLFKGYGLEGALKRTFTSSLSSEGKTVQNICRKVLRNPNQ